MTLTLSLCRLWPRALAQPAHPLPHARLRRAALPRRDVRDGGRSVLAVLPPSLAIRPPVSPELFTVSTHSEIGLAAARNAIPRNSISGKVWAKPTWRLPWSPPTRPNVGSVGSDGSFQLETLWTTDPRLLTGSSSRPSDSFFLCTYDIVMVSTGLKLPPLTIYFLLF